MNTKLLPLLFLFACADKNSSDTGSDTPADGDDDGYTAVQGDCDDGDAAVNPKEEETPYDGVDNDCNATTLDDDLDGDGATVAVDCDDDNANILPGAVETCNGLDDDCDGTVDDDAADLSIEEECNNGIDDNCDGSLNDCQLTGERTLEEADASFIGQRAGDFAILTGAPSDLDGDGVGDAVIAVAADDAASGITYVFHGPLTGSLVPEDAAATISGIDEGAWPFLTAAGDLNGDDIPDLALVRGHTTAGGALVDVLFGPLVGALDQPGADAHLLTDAERDGVPYNSSALRIGDLNDDGAPDLLTQAVYYDGAGTFVCLAPAEVTVTTGPLDGDRDLSDAALVFTEVRETCYGDAVFAGDLDGDGVGDLTLSTPGAGTTGEGAAYLFLAPTASAIFSDADQTLNGDEANAYFGDKLAPAGDVNQDGYDDLWISAYVSDANGTNSGDARLFVGRVGGADPEPYAEVSGQEGRAVDALAVGDFNGDGASDLLIGDFYDDAPGTTALLYGPLSGTATVAEADARFIGTQTADYNGAFGIYAGDIDGDGQDDAGTSAVGLNDYAGGAFFFTTLGM